MSKITIPKTTYRHHDFDPETYLLSEPLAAAVQVAMTLGVPLLVTGEPGTGKTRLAYRVAHDLHGEDVRFDKEPLIFNTKTTSAAQDLFYTYDAIGHFHEAAIAKQKGEGKIDVMKHITPRALGQAIDKTKSGKSSVVLIDEIDKAPRDFANDLLNEIENYQYEIKELPQPILKTKHPDQNIVVIMTSNSEKNLPEAFLRRVVFYHIDFPKPEELQRIVRSQLTADSRYTDAAFIEHFQQVRNAILRKKPATDELLKWLYILEIEGFVKDNNIDFDKLTDEQIKILKNSYSVLAKTKEDLDLILKPYQ